MTTFLRILGRPKPVDHRTVFRAFARRLARIIAGGPAAGGSRPD